GPWRRELGERPQRLRERQSAPQPGERKQGAQASRAWDRREDQRPHEPLIRRPLVAFLDVGPRLLDQPVVLDAGRTRRHTGHAAEAAVEVLDRAGGGSHRAVQESLHEVDPPARRISLLLPEGSVCWARW